MKPLQCYINTYDFGVIRVEIQKNFKDDNEVMVFALEMVGDDVDLEIYNINDLLDQTDDEYYSTEKEAKNEENAKSISKYFS